MSLEKEEEVFGASLTSTQVAALLPEVKQKRSTILEHETALHDNLQRIEVLRASFLDSSLPRPCGPEALDLTVCYARNAAWSSQNGLACKFEAEKFVRCSNRSAVHFVFKD